MKTAEKRWYETWWFVLLVFLAGLAFGALITDGWLDGWSGMNL